MSNPWPERRSTPWGFGHKDYEDDAEYTVFLLQQLFVEMAELKAKLNHPMTEEESALRPSTYVGGAAPLVPRTVTLSLVAEDWDDIRRISWKRLMNDEILLSLIVASRLAGDRAEASQESERT